MNYIHNIDSEMMNSLKNMLKSKSEQDMELAVEILNNANVKDPETHYNIEQIISDYSTNIMFDFSEPNNEKTFTFYTRKQWNNHIQQTKNWDRW